MGLDQYLEKSIYIGGRYEHTETTGTIHIEQKNREPIDLDVKTIESINIHVAYWRKANQIHQWFTVGQNDDTRSEKSGEELLKLVEICKKVIASLEKQELIKKTEKSYGGKEYEIEVYPNIDLAMELLPPQSGFFFGDYNVGEWYVEDLKDTIEQLKDVDPSEFYEYTASY